MSTLLLPRWLRCGLLAVAGALAIGDGTALAQATAIWGGRAIVHRECGASTAVQEHDTLELRIAGLGTDLWVVHTGAEDVLSFRGRDPNSRTAHTEDGRLALSLTDAGTGWMAELTWSVHGCRRVFRANVAPLDPASPDVERTQFIAEVMRDADRAGDLARSNKIKEAIALATSAVERAASRLGSTHRATAHARSSRVDAIVHDADYDLAQRLALELAAELATAYGEDDAMRLATLARAARLDVDRGQLDAASRRYDDVLPKLREALGEHRLYCFATFSAGYLFRQLGAFRRALDANRDAVSCMTVADGPYARLTLGFLTEQAFVLYKLGRSGEALALALDTYRHQLERFGPLDRGTIINLDNIGGYYLELGRIDEAVDTQRRAQQLYEQAYGVDHPYTLLPLGNLVNVLRTAGRHEEVLPLAERAYRLHAKAYGESHTTTLFNRHWYAIALGRNGRWKEALAEHEAVLAARRAQFGPEDIHVLDSRRAVALSQLRLGNADAAYRELADVCPLHERLEGPTHHATLDCRRELGIALLTLGRNDDAVAELERYVAAAEAQRAIQAATAESRQAFLSSHAPTYKRLAVLHARAGRARDALRVAELVKGRTLLETLITQRADELAPLEPSERAELREREEQLLQLDDQVAEAREDATRRLAIDAQRQQVVASLQSLRARLRERYPQYEQMEVARSVDAQAAAPHLPSGTVFVSYVLSDRDLVILTLDGRARVAVTTVDGTRVRSAMQAFRARLGPETTPAWRLADGTFAVGIERPSGARPVTSIDEPLAALAESLVAPIATTLGPRSTWIVAVDEVLAGLPIELLPFRGGRVVDRVNVSYVQSLAVHVRLAERAQAYRTARRTSDLLSVGAVDYGSKVAVAGTTTRSVAARTSRPPVAEWMRSNGLTWAPLPGSAREVDRLRVLFPRSRRLTGAAATEARVAAMNASGELAGFRMLHFATHGFVDLRDPMLSAIVLAQPPGEGFDGYLTAREWLDYRLRSDLTVLSACETALGGIVAGEGVLGLPYALFVAGNRNTVLSLWKVPDASAAEFMSRFFRHLKAGRPHAVALARTKRELRRESRWRDPIHWAGYVLYGS